MEFFFRLSFCQNDTVAEKFWKRFQAANVWRSVWLADMESPSYTRPGAIVPGLLFFDKRKWWQGILFGECGSIPATGISSISIGPSRPAEILCPRFLLPKHFTNPNQLTRIPYSRFLDNSPCL
jgi:hypothetical protein